MFRAAPNKKPSNGEQEEQLWILQRDFQDLWKRQQELSRESSEIDFKMLEMKAKLRDLQIRYGSCGSDETLETRCSNGSNDSMKNMLRLPSRSSLNRLPQMSKASAQEARKAGDGYTELSGQYARPAMAPSHRTVGRLRNFTKSESFWRRNKPAPPRKSKSSVDGVAVPKTSTSFTKKIIKIFSRAASEDSLLSEKARDRSRCRESVTVRTRTRASQSKFIDGHVSQQRNSLVKRSTSRAGERRVGLIKRINDNRSRAYVDERPALRRQVSRV